MDYREGVFTIEGGGVGERGVGLGRGGGGEGEEEGEEEGGGREEEAREVAGMRRLSLEFGIWDCFRSHRVLDDKAKAALAGKEFPLLRCSRSKCLGWGCKGVCTSCSSS